jgi:broad specificity phosphatase PhoE
MGALHLVRHGHSSYPYQGQWLNLDDVARFEREYDIAGIRDDSLPPPSLVEIASRAAVIAASDLPRAIESARRLAPSRDADLSPLLREIRLETIEWLPRRLPLPVGVWDIMSFTQWSYRLMTRADHEFVRRADAALDWLLERTIGDAPVVAVTHGGFRRILDARLLMRAWRRIPGESSYANWSSWSYRQQGD